MNRPCEQFIRNRGCTLADSGFEPDPGRVTHTSNGCIVFYHYSREDRLEQIFADGSGLWARLPVTCPHLPDDFAGTHLVEGFLEPFPKWLWDSPYFGDLGLEMINQYVGNVLLRIEVPSDFPGLYVADYAHVLECKHLKRRGRPALHLGYDCATGKEITQGYVHSYTPIGNYAQGHVAPVVQAIRKGPGIAIPREYIKVADEQPRP